jgi:hypothetical protein
MPTGAGIDKHGGLHDDPAWFGTARQARLLAMTNILDGMKKATSFSRSALNARFDRRRCSSDA